MFEHLTVLFSMDKNLPFNGKPTLTIQFMSSLWVVTFKITLKFKELLYICNLMYFHTQTYFF